MIDPFYFPLICEICGKNKKGADQLCVQDPALQLTPLGLRPLPSGGRKLVNG